jgi:hypothetical protein
MAALLRRKYRVRSFWKGAGAESTARRYPCRLEVTRREVGGGSESEALGSVATESGEQRLKEFSRSRDACPVRLGNAPVRCMALCAIRQSSLLAIGRTQHWDVGGMANQMAACLHQCYRGI